MFVYSYEAAKRKLTAWGIEVKKRLLDLQIMQDDVVSRLNNLGFKINKVEFSNLLYGVGVSCRKNEIAEINKMLNIPHGE
jgi:hypothetical protein